MSTVVMVVPERLTAGSMTPRVLLEAQFVTALLGDVALDEEDVEYSHILHRGRTFYIRQLWYLVDVHLTYTGMHPAGVYLKHRRVPRRRVSYITGVY
jgi:hypothetical protein